VIQTTTGALNGNGQAGTEKKQNQPPMLEAGGKEANPYQNAIPPRIQQQEPDPPPCSTLQVSIANAPAKSRLESPESLGCFRFRSLPFLFREVNSNVQGMPTVQNVGASIDSRIGPAFSSGGSLCISCRKAIDAHIIALVRAPSSISLDAGTAHHLLNHQSHRARKDFPSG